MKPLAPSIVALAVVGERASLRMWRKAHLEAQGLLAEPSVVQQPAAKLVFGIPNAALGAAYYALVVAAQLPLPARLRPLARGATGAASLASSAMSTVLAVSLARKRLGCVNCWTAHGVNAALLALLALQRRGDRAA